MEHPTVWCSTVDCCALLLSCDFECAGIAQRVINPFINFIMLQTTLIGNIGADAQVKNTDGREFVSFRVAHNESYTKEDGTKVGKSQWVDCVMSCTNGRPAILPYLTAGTLVYVVGSMSVRAYPSEKDRCWKAGVTIHVTKVELLGGTADAVPRRLYDADGVMHDVTKYYHCDVEPGVLRDTRGREYEVVKGGWVGLKKTDDANQG